MDARADQPRVPAGVRTGGRFAVDPRREADVSLAPDGPDLTSLTPVEVDEQIVALLTRLAGAQRTLERSMAAVHQSVGDSPRYGHPYAKTTQQALDEARTLAAAGDLDDDDNWQGRKAARAVEEHDTARALVGELQGQVAAREDEHARRGRWARAFLATNADGHVHSSTGCSTCNKGRTPTSFQWMTAWSGADEAQIVADAGWRACTVCYPSAPVGDARTLPTAMFSDDERDRELEREQRQAAKAARAAAAIEKGLTADGSPFEVSWVETDAPGWDVDPATGRRAHVRRDRTREESFKTERAATTWYVQQRSWGDSRTGDKRSAFEAIEQALAAKHGLDVEQVRADLERKVSAKVARDGR